MSFKNCYLLLLTFIDMLNKINFINFIINKKLSEKDDLKFNLVVAINIQKINI